MKLDDLSPEEVEELNKQTEADLRRDVEQYESERKLVVSRGLSHLLDVVGSELFEIKFTGEKGEAVLKVKANPPQSVMRDLMRISQAAEKGMETTEEDEDRLCRILEDLTVEPSIPYDVWKSGDVPDEIPASIIVELVKYKAMKQDEMEADITSFRKNRQGSKAAGNRGDNGKATE